MATVKANAQPPLFQPYNRAYPLSQISVIPPRTLSAILIPLRFMSCIPASLLCVMLVSPSSGIFSVSSSFSISVFSSFSAADDSCSSLLSSPRMTSSAHSMDALNGVPCATAPAIGVTAITAPQNTADINGSKYFLLHIFFQEKTANDAQTIIVISSTWKCVMVTVASAIINRNKFSSQKYLLSLLCFLSR